LFTMSTCFFWALEPMKGKTLTVACKMLASAFIIREPAVHPDFAAELHVNEIITVLAFGELSVGEASPFHIIA
jgi:hypothetical protein